MAYIGVDPNIGDITFQTFTGTGSATAFTLAQSVVSGEALLVTIGNVVQEPGASKAYTAQGNTLTFSAAPANGDVITVRFFGRAVDQPTSYAMQLFKYVATNNQTAFTGADANGAILAFSGDDVDVYLNGVHLDSSDFTASNGDTITLGTGAAASDELVIRAYRAFTVTDTVSKASGGTFVGAVTVPQLNADNLRLDGNTISSTDTNGNVNIDPAGTGDTVMTGSGGQVTVDENGHITSKQSLDATTAGGRITGATNRGTVSQIELSQTTSSADGGYIRFLTCASGSTSPTERVRIDASGNVGLGTSSPARQLDVYDDGTNGQAVIAITAQNTDNSRIMFADTDDNNIGIIDYNHSDNTMRFVVNNAERMRLISNGQILIGCTSSPSSSVPGFQISPDLSSEWSRSGTSLAGATRHIGFYNTNGLVGDIITNQNSTSFQSLSDYRVKENVVDLTGAIDRVKALEPKRFNFISNADITVDGFLAHEAQTVVPESVNGTKDGMRDEEYIVSAATGDIYTPAAPATYDEDGEELTAATNEVIHSSDAEKPEELADGQQWRETTAAVMGTRSVPDYQGIDQAKLVPLLTAALKESIAKIETLETQRADLEARLTALES